MNFHIKHRGIECPSDIEQAIEEKLRRFERLLPENTYVEIELKQLPKIQRNGDKEAEVVVDIPGVKPVVRFVCPGQTWLEAIDCAFDKLDEDLSRHKKKQRDHSLHHQHPPKELLADTVNRGER